jgi:16S rRNA (uracil1498-N3)-methyltransferase
MNLVLFDGDDVASDHVILRDHRAQHIRKILKLEVGAKLRVGRIDGGIGTASIAESNENEIRLQIIELNGEPPPPSRMELILALPRPKSLKRCLRAIANLGVKSIHLIHSSKVDKSYWSAPALEPAVLRQTLLDGLSIARDTVMPTVQLI